MLKHIEAEQSFGLDGPQPGLNVGIIDIPANIDSGFLAQIRMNQPNTRVRQWAENMILDVRLLRSTEHFRPAANVDDRRQCLGR
jgi:hypothetical protein